MPIAARHENEALVEAVAVLLHCIVLGGPGAGASKIFRDECAWMMARATALRHHPWTSPKTHVRAYYILRTALLALPESYRDFLRWLCGSSDESAARAAWPELVRRVMPRLDSVLSRQAPGARDTDPAASLGMGMVRHQITLRPKRTAGAQPTSNQTVPLEDFARHSLSLAPSVITLHGRTDHRCTC